MLVKSDRIIFAELKRDNKVVPTADQTFVLTLLSGAAEIHIWRPDDIDAIARVLATSHPYVSTKVTT